MKQQYILIDLFSGAGGFTKGLLDAGFEFKHIFYSDVDKYANAVYSYNYEGHIGLNDVRTIKAELIPQGRSVVTFGFPCQDVSIAGKRAGFDGKRSSLFFEAIRIIRDIKPDIFIFENVKGLFSSNEGRDFATVLRTIADIGLYDCEWQLVNTKWVLPQNRERVFFVGHLRGSSWGKVFPFGEDAEICAETGTSKTRRGGVNEHTPALDHNCYVGVKALTECRSEEAKKNRKKTRKNTGKDFSPRRGKDITTRKDNNSNTITATQTVEQQILQGHKIRRLTPVECERLQGFPDDWTKYGILDGKRKRISDTQRYKLMGNAVTVKMVEMIGRMLLK
jgi:DNA (cytosine-5)-methyltransferase 1